MRFFRNIIRRVRNLWKISEYSVVEFVGTRPPELQKNTTRRIKKMAVIARRSEEREMDKPEDEFPWG